MYTVKNVNKNGKIILCLIVVFMFSASLIGCSNNDSSTCKINEIVLTSVNPLTVVSITAECNRKEYELLESGFSGMFYDMEFESAALVGEVNIGGNANGQLILLPGSDLTFIAVKDSKTYNISIDVGMEYSAVTNDGKLQIVFDSSYCLSD